MKPLYTYRPDIAAYELVQDGYVLGYMKRGYTVLPNSGAECHGWVASIDGVRWHSRVFEGRQQAREYLEAL